MAIYAKIIRFLRKKSRSRKIKTNTLLRKTFTTLRGFRENIYIRARLYICVIVGIIFTGLFLVSSAFAQSSSSSYRLDYDRTVSDAGTKQSSSYNLIGAFTTISAEGESTSYNLRNVYAGTPAIGAICGNGIIEASEQCEGMNFGGLTCGSFGYIYGNLQCVNCMIVTTGCFNPSGGGGGAICGNGILEGGEQCDDGNAISGDGCSAGCRIEYPVCGNGITEIGEECDDGNINYGDGCTPECKLEEKPIEEPKEEPAEEKTDLSFEVTIEKTKPYEIRLRPTVPTGPVPELKPAAPEQENYEYHFEDFQVGGMITVLDETPFVVLNAKPNAFYELAIYNENGVLISRQGAQSDQNGLLKIESLPYLDYKTYRLDILDSKHEVHATFPITIEDRKYRIHETIGTNGEIVRETICLGQFEKGKLGALSGKGKSGNIYYAYLQSFGHADEPKVNPIYVISTVADNDGYYEIPMPENLEAGFYHIDIVQIYEDGKVSRNLRYTIGFTEEKTAPCIWVLISIFAMVIAGQWRRVGKSSNKKNKASHGFTIRILATILAMLILGQQSLPALAITTTPGVVIYEGKLLNSANTPITTAQTFRFSIWSSGDMVAGDVVAGAINPLAPNYGGWQEVQTITPNIDGTFFFKLGSVTALPDMLLANHQFLQVEIKPQGAPDTSYELMDPTGDNGADADDRQTIGSSPYANNADFIDNAELGTSAGDIAVLDVGGIWNINFMPDGTNFDTFIIDYDDTSVGDIVLQFGNLLGAFIKFDIINNWFEFSNSINLAQNEIKNFAIDNLAAAPATPVSGQMYYNTTDGNTYIWNGIVWEDITAVGGSGGDDLDTVYTADADKKMNVNNAAGLEFESTVAGDIIFDLQGTGDLAIQTGGTTFATFTDGGNVGIGTTTPSTILDVNSGAVNTTPIFTLGNTAGDMQIFRIDATPEGTITGSIGDFAIDGTNGTAYIKNSGNATNTGWVQFGGSRVKQMVFNVEYEDAVAIGDGADNRGTLTSKFIDAGARKYNFAEWVTSRATIQDVDIVYSIRLPDDFISFTATPLEIIYTTSDADTGKNKVDVYLYDTTDTAVPLVGASALANGAWTSANITFGGAPTFTAGDTITLIIKLSATNAGKTKVADVIFDYNGL